LPEGVTARLTGRADRRALTADGELVAPGQEVRLAKGEHTITFSI